MTSRPFVRATLLLVVVAAHVRFAVAPWSVLNGFPLDDAWIHQVVARTFASSGTLGYAPGMHGAGATSYLWAALLACNFKAFHVSPVAYTLGLNAALTVCSMQLLFVLVEDTLPGARRSAHGVAAAAAVAVACCCANVIWFTFSGMEAMLIVALSLAAIVAWSRPSRSSRTAWLAGASAGLLALSRPECIALAPFLAVSVRWTKRPRAHLGALLGPWALGLVIYLGSNLLLAGSALPATLGGRRWLWADASVGLSRVELAVELAAEWLQRLRDYTLGTSSSLVLWCALGVAAFALFDPRVRRARGLVLLAGWVVVHFAFYAVLLPTPGHGGRYQPFVPLLFALGLGLGSRAALFAFFARFATMPRRHEVAAALTAIACAAWIGVLLVGVVDLGHDHVRAVSHIRATEQAVGMAIRELPPGARVASFDIGASGFFADRAVRDIGGLSDAATVSHLRDGDVWKKLRDDHVQYVVVPVAYTDDTPDPVHFGYRLRLVNNPAVRLDAVRVFRSPPSVWIAGARAVQHASPVQVLYRLEFTGEEGPPPLRTTAPFDEPLLDPTLYVESRARHQLHHGLALLAGAGVQVRVELHQSAPDPAHVDTAKWVATLASNGVRLQPPDGLSIDQPLATALLAERARPYLDEGDYGGLLRLTTWTIAELIRTRQDARFLPPLPAVEPPRLARAAKRMARRSISWGVPLAASIAAVLFASSIYGKLLLRRTRKRGSSV